MVRRLRLFLPTTGTPIVFGRLHVTADFYTLLNRAATTRDVLFLLFYLFTYNSEIQTQINYELVEG